MTPSLIAFALFLGFAVSESFAGTSTAASTEESDETDASKWKFSLEILTYLAQHARDYANPTFNADYGNVHLETRYNYEAIKTGSIWLGYYFSIEKDEKHKLEAAPMIGGVFGDITGVAPGYTITITYEPFELYTVGEYFFDANIQAGDFFYSWSEFSCKPLSFFKRESSFKVGLVIDRTKVFGSDFDVRRGPLVGFSHCGIDLTAYWLSPGSKNATFVFGVAHEF